MMMRNFSKRYTIAFDISLKCREREVHTMNVSSVHMMMMAKKMRNREKLLMQIHHISSLYSTLFTDSYRMRIDYVYDTFRTHFSLSFTSSCAFGYVEINR